MCSANAPRPGTATTGSPISKPPTPSPSGLTRPAHSAAGPHGRDARAANAAAAALAEAAGPGRLIYPVEANELFVRMTAEEAATLRSQGYDFYDWAPDEVRFVTSWDQDLAAVGRAHVDLVELLGKAPIARGQRHDDVVLLVAEHELVARTLGDEQTERIGDGVRRQTEVGGVRRILNCQPSPGTETDWRMHNATDPGVLRAPARAIPASRDLRGDWWTGGCGRAR